MAIPTREVVIVEEAALADAGTYERGIRMVQPISAIDVIIQATNGSTSNQGVFLHDDVTEIQVLNGPDVVHQLGLAQGIGLNFLETGRLPALVLTESGGATQRERYRIHFGRYLGDPEYWLDPVAASDLLIRVTTDLTISAATGFATGTGRITIIVHLFDEAPGPAAGFLTAKSLSSWSAAGVREIALPTDHPYRLIGLRLAAPTATWEDLLFSWRLSLDGSTFVAFDLAAQDLLTLGKTARLSRSLFRVDGDTIDTLLGYPQGIVIDALQDLSLASADAFGPVSSGPQATVQLLALTTTPTITKNIATDRELRMRALGLLPLQCTGLHLGSPSVADTWLDPTRYGVATSRVETGATATASLFLQQARLR